MGAGLNMYIITSYEPTVESVESPWSFREWIILLPLNPPPGLKSPQNPATSSFGVAGDDQTFHGPELSSVKGMFELFLG